VFALRPRVVEYFTDDVAAIYGDEYFPAPSITTGYGDYALAANTGRMAAAFFDALKPAGKVLDIGCANGHLLRKLGGGFELS